MGIKIVCFIANLVGSLKFLATLYNIYDMLAPCLCSQGFSLKI